MSGKGSLRLVADRADGRRQISDDGLMLRSADDDLQAFTRLVGRYEVPIRRFCYGMLGSRHAAEEAAQEIFLKVWLNRKRYRQSDRFRAYIYTIARNRCISQLRRRKILTFVGLDGTPNQAETLPGNDEVFDEAERNALVRSAVAKLPPKLRAAILLRFVEEMSYDEMADIVGRSASAVRSRVHYGLKSLARSLPREVRTWGE